MSATRSASPLTIPLGARFSAWHQHHGETAGSSFMRLLRQPFATMITCLAIGVAFSLPSGLYLLLKNTEQITAQWQGSAQLSLYLKAGSKDADATELAATLEANPNVITANYLSQTAALSEFKKLSGIDDIIGKLDDNPLPAVISVVFADVPELADKSQALTEQMRKHKLVEKAQLDLEWLQRLSSMVALAKRFALLLAAVLLTGVVLVIGNTIRLAIESRREEIVVVKLVGGTNAFVRRPFLYTGFWYGLGGAVAGCAILLGGGYWLLDRVQELAALYDYDRGMAGLSWQEGSVLCLAGALLGISGAWLAVGRHLSAIEPR